MSTTFGFFAFFDLKSSICMKSKFMWQRSKKIVDADFYPSYSTTINKKNDNVVAS